MRNSFRCPKCASRRVVEVVGSSMNQQTKIPLTRWSFKNATLDRYICTACGYTEEYVQLESDFLKWADKAINKQDKNYDDYV